ncbi:MAG: hypothetical protein ACE5FT_07675 [Candidatus Nanoarchaeia archaeon]
MAENSLLISALVAVVAIVGLVVLMDAPTGALSYSSYRSDLPIGADASHYYAGYGFGADCGAVDTSTVSFSDSRRCCYDKCAEFCAGKTLESGGYTLSDCGSVCTSSCEIRREEDTRTAGRTRGLRGDRTQIFG